MNRELNYINYIIRRRIYKSFPNILQNYTIVIFQHILNNRKGAFLIKIYSIKTFKLNNFINSHVLLDNWEKKLKISYRMNIN